MFLNSCLNGVRELKGVGKGTFEPKESTGKVLVCVCRKKAAEARAEPTVTN